MTTTWRMGVRTASARWARAASWWAVRWSPPAVATWATATLPPTAHVAVARAAIKRFCAMTSPVSGPDVWAARRPRPAAPSMLSTARGADVAELCSRVTRRPRGRRRPGSAAARDQDGPAHHEQEAGDPHGAERHVVEPEPAQPVGQDRGQELPGHEQGDHRAGPE